MANRFKFSWRSIRALRGIHPDLITVCRIGLATTEYDFIVTEGLRSIGRQRELFAAGASRTMKSKHIAGEAFDIAVLVNQKVTWDAKYYRDVARTMHEAAHVIGVRIKWGGDFNAFFDGPHFQLAGEY